MTTVLITPEAMRNKPSRYVDMLRQASFEVQYPKNEQLSRGLCSEEEMIAELSDCAAAIAGNEVYSDRVLAALPQLRVIARAGVGFDHVDVAAATARRIAVTITPTANHAAVAEQALALLLAVAKSVVVNDRHARAGRWPKQFTAAIRGATLGIFGLGRIGRSMATRAIALGMRTIATEPHADQAFVEQHPIQLVDFQTLLAQSDYLSIHCPLNEHTARLFNREAFAQMKPGSVLINTARGDLVVEAHLIEALSHGHLRGAGLDVFEQEPPSPDNPLFQLDNVVVSPHIGGIDRLSLEDMGIESADCIIKLRDEQWPDGAVVNSQLRDGWKW